MMHKAWSSIEEVPYCFSRSSIKFQVHTGQKLPILTRIDCFRTGTPVWIHWWLGNDAQSLMWQRGGALLFLSRSSIKIFRSHGLKNRRLESNLSKITRPVAAIKSLRFALFKLNPQINIMNTVLMHWRYCCRALNYRFVCFQAWTWRLSEKRMMRRPGSIQARVRSVIRRRKQLMGSISERVYELIIQFSYYWFMCFSFEGNNYGIRP